MNSSKIRLNSEYDKIFDMINNKENFTLLRYGDGERAIANGNYVKAQEGWESPSGITELGKAIVRTFDLMDENVYYGISCPCCDQSAYYWYTTRIANKNKTFANMFVNCNYRRFINQFQTIERDAIVIANYAGKNNKIGNLNVLKYYSVGDSCVDFWDNYAENLINQIIADYGTRKDLMYVVSAGPLSEPIIYKLFKNNADNTYIDFGSSIDYYIHGKDTRPYSDIKTDYANRNCWMYEPNSKCMDISVILTAYKKPEALIRQIEAINNQTIKPKNIFLFQDGIEGEYAIKFNEEVLSKFTDVKIEKKNVGVWGRFRYALERADTEYVCIFDDDTIPGKRWLENCFSNMIKEEGVYGTIGIVLKKPENYPFSDFDRIGWANPYSKTCQVDFVGHSWFIKKEYLNYMFDNTEKFQKFKLSAEDMCLSFKCQQKGIKTFVPPHPYDDIELWGSIPKYGWKYGKMDTAISVNTNNMRKMKCAIKDLIDDGWKPVYVGEKNKLNHIKREIKFETKVYRLRKQLKRIKRKIKKEDGNV